MTTSFQKTGWRECQLGEVIVSNSQSISKEYPYETIRYLDTGSITCGKIDSYQEYLLKEAPSRARRLVKENDIDLPPKKWTLRKDGVSINALS